jgi:hypothetical protein
MKIADHVFEHFRAIVRRLSPLSEEDQIEALKTELLAALERADVCERRVHRLEDEVDNVKFYDRLFGPVTLTQLENRVVAAARPRDASDEARRKRELEVVRHEIVEMGVQCQALDAFCRLLLRRMEAAENAPSDGTRSLVPV